MKKRERSIAVEKSTNKRHKSCKQQTENPGNAHGFFENQLAESVKHVKGRKPEKGQYFLLNGAGPIDPGEELKREYNISFVVRKGMIVPVSKSSRPEKTRLRFEDYSLVEGLFYYLRKEGSCFNYYAILENGLHKQVHSSCKFTLNKDGEYRLSQQSKVSEISLNIQKKTVISGRLNYFVNADRETLPKGIKISCIPAEKGYRYSYIDKKTNQEIQVWRKETVAKALKKQHKILDSQASFFPGNKDVNKTPCFDAVCASNSVKAELPSSICFPENAVYSEDNSQKLQVDSIIQNSLFRWNHEKTEVTAPDIPAYSFSDHHPEFFFLADPAVKHSSLFALDEDQDMRDECNAFIYGSGGLGKG